MKFTEGNVLHNTGNNKIIILFDIYFRMRIGKRDNCTKYKWVK